MIGLICFDAVKKPQLADEIGSQMKGTELPELR
jgi:hypothetical protein